jgi:AAA+ superfamily predicted ATPase
MKILKFNKGLGGYTFKNKYKTVGIVPCTYENVEAYSHEDYTTIFPGYNSETDYIEKEVFGDCCVLVLKRYETDRTGEVMTPGYYMVKYIDYALTVVPMGNIEFDNFIELNNNACELQEDIIRFFENKPIYDSLKMRHKRAALIYGAPGNGKTTTILKASKDVIAEGGVVIFISKNVEEMSDLLILKDVLPEKSVVVIEELTNRASDTPEEILSFLDGEFSWQGCYVIATTNYPEDLERNIVDRPGRFDLLLEFPDPDENTRKMYLNSFLDGASDTIIHDTKGFSIVYLKELVLGSLLNREPITVTLQRLKDRKKKIGSSFTTKGGFAF